MANITAQSVRHISDIRVIKMDKSNHFVITISDTDNRAAIIVKKLPMPKKTKAEHKNSQYGKILWIHPELNLIPWGIGDECYFKTGIREITDEELTEVMFI